MNILKSSLLAAAVAVGGITSANAANDTDTFGVQLVVNNSCTITATGGTLNFGTVTGTIATDVDSFTTLSVNCNSGATYSVGLNDGTHSTTPGERRLQSGANYLDYELYSDSGRSSVWTAANTTGDVDGTGNNAAQSLTVYGRVPGGQSVPAGTYTDTVTATIEF
jgi:spore coat protein U-like protein